MSDYLGRFDDHSDSGPFTMLMVHPVRRERLKTGQVVIHLKATPNALIFPPHQYNDTWRFNFLLDLLFEDGSHLIARANGVELTSDGTRDDVYQSFGIE
jgi:hypothetical protein